MTEHSEISIDVAEGTLGATLAVPQSPRGIVIFAHGSGSSRFSPRNRLVADRLNADGFATLLMDLLTSDEDARDRVTAELRFEVTLLAERLSFGTRWAAERFAGAPLPAGYFGASTGAAAALIAAADTENDVRAVVSRGGRPDLAGASLQRVKAATLLIAGGEDHVVVRLNRQAQAAMRCTNELEIVPGAGHLFEEPGALEHVAQRAAEWFREHLKAVPT